MNGVNARVRVQNMNLHVVHERFLEEETRQAGSVSSSSEIAQSPHTFPFKDFVFLIRFS
jgi:hypothetical protein